MNTDVLSKPEVIVEFGSAYLLRHLIECLANMTRIFVMSFSEDGMKILHSSPEIKVYLELPRENFTTWLFTGKEKIIGVPSAALYARIKKEGPKSSFRLFTMDLDTGSISIQGVQNPAQSLTGAVSLPTEYISKPVPFRVTPDRPPDRTILYESFCSAIGSMSPVSSATIYIKATRHPHETVLEMNTKAEYGGESAVFTFGNYKDPETNEEDLLLDQKEKRDAYKTRVRAEKYSEAIRKLLEQEKMEKVEKVLMDGSLEKALQARDEPLEEIASVLVSKPILETLNGHTKFGKGGGLVKFWVEDQKHLLIKITMGCMGEVEFILPDTRTQA